VWNCAVHMVEEGEWYESACAIEKRFFHGVTRDGESSHNRRRHSERNVMSGADARPFVDIVGRPLFRCYAACAISTRCRRAVDNMRFEFTEFSHVWQARVRQVLPCVVQFSFLFTCLLTQPRSSHTGCFSVVPPAGTESAQRPPACLPSSPTALPVSGSGEKGRGRPG